MIPSLFSRKLVLGSILITAVGIGGLFLLEYLVPANPKPWWYAAPFQLAGTLVSVGLVGIFVEISFGLRLFSQFIQNMRQLFDEDPSLARSLNEEVRQSRVKETLRAHLGSDEGSAVYNAMVHPYLSGKSLFRRQTLDEITIDSLRQDIIIETDGERIVFPKSNYHRLIAITKFSRIFDPQRCQYVACILVDDYQELYYWFNRSDCIFRDVVSLADSEKIHILRLIKQTDVPLSPILQAIFNVRVLIDNKHIPLGEIQIGPLGKSISIKVEIPQDIIDSSKNKIVDHEIKLEGLITKSEKKYPVILSEPHLNPTIVFKYPTRAITNVVPAPFFAGEAPFDPRIERFSDQGEKIQIRITLPPGTDERSWVFPNSGVIFTWDNV
jgi:hypothetical protein